MFNRYYGIGLALSGIVHALPAVIMGWGETSNQKLINFTPITVEFINSEPNNSYTPVPQVIAPPPPTKKTFIKPDNIAHTPDSPHCYHTSNETSQPLTNQDILASNPKPLYPEEARLLGICGRVIVDIEIERGKLISCLVRESPHDLLAEATLLQVRQWIFPKNCARTHLTIPIDFELIDN